MEGLTDVSKQEDEGVGPHEAVAETPAERTPPEVSPAPQIAGGWGSVAASVAAVHAGPGLLRGTRALLAVNQKDGFDCPGCAWPEPAGERAVTEFCENGAKAVAWETTRLRADAAFFARHSVADLGAQSDYWLGQQGRLTEPMVLEPGASHYVPIDWDQAFERVAGSLRGLAHPEEAAFYTSGRTSNEAAFLYQLFARQFGTNNLPDCSNMCHESSGVALKETLGVGKGTVQLEDFEHAEVILVVGQNPGTNHPRMLTTLQAAARRGATLVSINPLAEAALVRFRHPQNPTELVGKGTPMASMHLPVRVGGDVALLQGVGKALLELEEARPGHGVARAFIEQHTQGFAAYAAAVSARTWEPLEASSGISRAAMQELAARLAGTSRIIACWAMGLTQHENAVANIQEVVNLLLLRGAMGVPGAGVCPVRGHSNVQGDRTMGIDHQPPAAFLDKLGRHFRFTPPRAHGLDVVGSLEAMRRGEVKVLFALGGNLLSAGPDTRVAAEALRRCRLTVQVSTKLNRSHLVTGATALILPCLGRTERDVQAGGPQFVTVEDSMGLVHRSEGVLAPAAPMLLSEPAIVARLAAATLGEKSRVPWLALAENYDRIRDAIEAVVPGFAPFNARVARDRTDGGFALPNAARGRVFETTSGKAHFTVHELPSRALTAGQFLLTTVRSHDQYNTTIYGLDDRYRGIKGGRRVVFIHADDLRELGAQAGEELDLTSHFRGETRTAARFRAVPYEIPRGCLAAYFPEANVLVPLAQQAARSGTPASKSLVVTLRRSDA